MQKPLKYINQVKRPVVRPCPCAAGHWSCNYVVISHILGCPYNCSYCFLHTFYGKDEIVVLKDEAKIVQAVADYLQKAEKPLRVGTGQFSDSLALPDAVSLAKKLVQLFAEQDKHLFEIKTKSNNVSQLLDLKHNGRTVVAWSVNPEAIVESDEQGAVRFVERLEAAKYCVAAGYPVGFHFDPIVFYPGWEADYQQVVDQIFAAVPADKIAWISLGALRFALEHEKLVKKKFPGSKIAFDQSKLAEDNKMRYPKELRVELFKTMNQFIRAHSKDVYVYLCMEPEDVWQQVDISNSSQNIYAGNFDFFVK